jgi:hypothetical protein
VIGVSFEVLFELRCFHKSMLRSGRGGLTAPGTAYQRAGRRGEQRA